MSKIIQTITLVVITMCLALTFVGCSEKERKTADITALNTSFKTTYADFFDDNGEFSVEYSDSVNNLIENSDNASLLNDYFNVVAKSSFSFFNLTMGDISDKDWNKDSRISVYKGLKSVEKSLYNLNNAKERFEVALDGYESGEINNIQVSNLTNYFKEYGDTIFALQKFQKSYINIYFKKYRTDFYNVDINKDIKAYDLKILLARKSFDLAKVSMDLEFKYYFEIENAKFKNEVKSNNATKLCEELNRVNSLNEKILGDITINDYKENIHTLYHCDNFFDRQMQILNQAIKDFDFKKMRKSDETEQAYVSKQNIKKQKQYEDVMYIAYDYIPQIVIYYSFIFNGMKF